MASQRNGTLYAGVTSDLVRRAGQHRSAAHDGFAVRNGCVVLVYFELHSDMSAAVAREKQIKARFPCPQARPDRTREPDMARPVQ